MFNTIRLVLILMLSILISVLIFEIPGLGLPNLKGILALILFFLFKDVGKKEEKEKQEFERVEYEEYEILYDSKNYIVGEKEFESLDEAKAHIHFLTENNSLLQ